jgi:uncharacterized protein YggU (UPF0235/DUF167 family)
MGEIYVKVEPESNEFEVENKAIPVIRLENRAESGRANQELKRRLKQIFGDKTGIVSGHRSRRKKVRCSLTKTEMEERLKQHG